MSGSRDPVQPSRGSRAPVSGAIYAAQPGAPASCSRPVRGPAGSGPGPPAASAHPPSGGHPGELAVWHLHDAVLRRQRGPGCLKRWPRWRVRADPGRSGAPGPHAGDGRRPGSAGNSRSGGPVSRLIPCRVRPPGVPERHPLLRVRCRRPGLLFIPGSVRFTLPQPPGRRSPRTTLPRRPASRCTSLAPTQDLSSSRSEEPVSLLVSSYRRGSNSLTICLRQMRRELLTHDKCFRYRVLPCRFLDIV